MNKKRLALIPFILVILALLAPAALAQSGGDYDLSWWTVDGGGGTWSSAAGFTLGGTIGQPDAGDHSGNGYTLAGGFWDNRGPTRPFLEIEWPPDDQTGGGCHTVRPTASLVGGGVFDRYEVETWYTGISSETVRLERRYLTPAQADSWRPTMPYPGYYTLEARATLSPIRSDWITATFCLDSVPPPAPAPVELCDLESGEWTNQDCLLGGWGAVDDWPSGLDHYSWCFGPGLCTPGVTTTLTATTWTLSDIAADGEYRLRATASDQLSNTSGIAEFLYSLDRVAPALAIVEPPGSVVRDAISLAWTSSDERSGLDHHAIRLDGPGGPYTFAAAGDAVSWTGGWTIPEGAYTMTLAAYDRAGNVAALPPWAVEMDRTPPLIVGGAVDWPPAQDPAFSAVVTATDAHAVVGYEWRAGDATGATGAPTWSASLSAEGVYTVEARASDEAGNWSDWTAIGLAVYDAAPPSPPPPEPPPMPGGATNDPAFTLADDPDVAYWTFAVEPPGEVFTTTVPPTGYTPPLTTSGVYTVTARACDEYGNCTEPWVFVIVFDNAPPTVSVGGPTGWTAQTQLEYTVTATDDLDADLLLWYCKGAGCTPDLPLAGDTIAWDVAASGLYTVAVEAIDDAHNTTQAAGGIAVDLTPPVIDNLTSNAGEWQNAELVPHFTWTAYDEHAGLGGFEAIVDGPGSVITVTFPASATGYLAAPVPADWEGEASFQLRAYDLAQPWQWSDWAAAVYRYDGRPPALEAAASVGEEWQNTNPTAVVAVNVSDGGSGLAGAWYCIAVEECTPDAALPADGVVAVQGQSETPTYLRAAAADALGNVITETVYTLRYDADPPRLALPGLPGLVTTPTFTVTARVSDVAVADASVVLLDGETQVDQCADWNDCALTFPDEGAYTVRLTAADEAGNEALLDAPLIYDASAPTVALDAPARASVADDSFTASWTVGADAVGWRFLVNGSEEMSGSGSTGSATVPVEPVAGTTALRVEAWDEVNHTGFDEAAVEIVADYDQDGMHDLLCEAEYGLNWRSPDDAGMDPDADGLTNLAECATGCADPHDPDSDDDDLSDGWEVEHGTDPCDPTSAAELASVAATPPEQTVGLGQVAHVAATVGNLGQLELTAWLTATFPGGASPDGEDAGWTVESGRAYRQVSLPSGGQETYDLPLVYDSLGDHRATLTILAATASITVHVSDASWLVLEAVEHPAEAHPQEQITVRTRVRNVSDVPAAGVALRVRLGEEETAYLRDLAARELWEQETDFVAPGWSAFPEAGAASLPVEVAGVQGYSGTLNVVGPRFDFEGEVKAGGGAATYTLQVANSGNRAGPLVARLTWPTGAAPVKVVSGNAWIEDGALIWQDADDVAVGDSRFAVVVVAVEGGGAYQPGVETEPAWALGTANLPPARAIWRLYLPLVSRGGEEDERRLYLPLVIREGEP